MDNKSLIKAFIPRILFLFTVFFSSNISAQTREFTYQVYAGGLHVIEAKLNFDIQNNNYDVMLNAHTRGWLSSLVPWNGTFKTNGAANENVFVPKKHASSSSWRGEVEIKTFDYKDNNLTSLTIQEIPNPAENIEIDQALTNNTTDLLSATLGIMKSIVKDGNCNGKSDIYDGKRRFELKFEDKGESELRKSRYNIFSGPARYCIVEIDPKGGRWHEKPRGWLSIQEQGRQKGALPAVWMAQVEGFAYAVPVKIRVKTDYGTLLMHLTDVK